MPVILGFAPFIVFAILTHVSVSLALWVALGTAFTLGIRTFLQKRDLRLLDAGSVALFAGLALYTGFIQPDLSMIAVRTIVDGGLAALALYSIIRRRPMTAAYARDQTADEAWPATRFLPLNYRITAVWAIAFAIMTLADLAALFGRLSLPLDMAIGLAGLLTAIVATARAPALARRQTHLAE